MKQARALMFFAALGTVYSHAAPSRTQLLSKLPLRFEASTDPSHSTFQARGSNFVLSLAPDGNVLEWHGSKRSSRLTTHLLGANPTAAMQPEDRLDGTANYFLGSPGAWRTGVAGFGWN